MKRSIRNFWTGILGAVAIVLFPALGQAQGTLFVEGDNVGVGVATPTTTLHVEKTDGTAKLLVRESSPSVAARELFELANNGGPFFVFKNNDIAQSWSFAMGSTGNFNLSHQQTPGVQFVLRPTGNLTISGTLTENSSRDVKHAMEPVDTRGILQKVASLPLAEWSYRSDRPGTRHLGPMAEDFYATFGLGGTDKGISTIDTSGVALAAIQGLHAELLNRDQRISDLISQQLELQGQNEDLQERLRRLEEMFASLE